MQLNDWFENNIASLFFFYVVLCGKLLISMTAIFIPIVTLNRGDNDYCPVPGTQKLSTLGIAEDNSKLEPKRTYKKSNSLNMVKQKVVIWF